MESLGAYLFTGAFRFFGVALPGWEQHSRRSTWAAALCLWRAAKHSW